MVNNQEIKKLTVGELFSQGEYRVPIYQRNYAWGDKEISQLIEDICGACKANKDKPYYIGSLVVFKDNDGIYEVIDGQQRLTTLVLLLHYLGVDYVTNDIEDQNLKKFKLSFEHRDDMENFLKYKKGKENKEANKEERKINSIERGYEIISQQLRKQLSNKEIFDKEISEDEFKTFLKEKVTIYRTEVPQGTDLNHYFEIMNNRGEQLEKHEVLKASMLSKLSHDEKANATFNTIWTACSEMDRYVVMGIKSDFRREIFGSERLNKFSWCDDYFSAEKFSQAKESELSIKEVLEGKEQISTDTKENEVSERFESIVSFSNFLMIALKIYKAENEKDIPLDEQKLISTFNEHFLDANCTAKEVKDFAIFLLRLRMLFDNYIIKRENNSKNEWSLQTPKWGSNSSIYYVNTFSKLNDDEQDYDTQKYSIMLLSMFHVSFPSTKYKQWLYEILDLLYRESIDLKDNFLNTLRDSYKVKLEEKARKYFLIRYEENKDALNIGTQVQNYFFNYLDYLLWKEWNENNLKDDKDFIQYFFSDSENVNEENVKKLRNFFESFYFAFRHSVEHCFPQSKADKIKNVGRENIIDQFGNLCLIHSSMNSALSNSTVQYKRSKVLEYSQYSKSLKQILMLMYSDEAWNDENVAETINHHQAKMFEILGIE